jgi:MFS family permease
MALGARKCVSIVNIVRMLLFKKFIIASIITFEVGSTICGAVPTTDAMILGRVIAGIGGAGMYLPYARMNTVFLRLITRSSLKLPDRLHKPQRRPDIQRPHRFVLGYRLYS